MLREVVRRLQSDGVTLVHSQKMSKFVEKERKRHSRKRKKQTKGLVVRERKELWQNANCGIKIW